MSAWSSRTAASCIRNRPSRKADQVSRRAPASPTDIPTIRTGSQSLLSSPIRQAMRIGGSNHSIGSKAAGTYQRQFLIRERFIDGSIWRHSSANTATTGPIANKASEKSRSVSVTGLCNHFLHRSPSIDFTTEGESPRKFLVIYRNIVRFVAVWSTTWPVSGSLSCGTIQTSRDTKEKPVSGQTIKLSALPSDSERRSRQDRKEQAKSVRQH
jgi:hypothetical protein